LITFFQQGIDACKLPNECFCFNGESDPDRLCNNTILNKLHQLPLQQQQLQKQRPLNNGVQKTLRLG
jgi:hypothetical protein